MIERGEQENRRTGDSSLVGHRPTSESPSLSVRERKTQGVRYSPVLLLTCTPARSIPHRLPPRLNLLHLRDVVAPRIAALVVLLVQPRQRILVQLHAQPRRVINRQ